MAMNVTSIANSIFSHQRYPSELHVPGATLDYCKIILGVSAVPDFSKLREDLSSFLEPPVKALLSAIRCSVDAISRFLSVPTTRIYSH